MAENDNDDNGTGTPDSGDQPPARPDAEGAAPTSVGPVVPPDQPAPAQPVLVTRWRDRAWSFQAMLAVAVATLLIGGIAGAAIVAVADDDDHDVRRGVFLVPGERGDRLPPGWRGPYRFRDGAPWRGKDGPGRPDESTSPTPSPSPSS